MIDNNWVQNWVLQQSFTDSGSVSWKIMSEVMSKLPNHSIQLGPVNNNGNYNFTIAGEIVNGTFTINK